MAIDVLPHDYVVNIKPPVNKQKKITCMKWMKVSPSCLNAQSLSKLISASLHIEHVYEDRFSPTSDYELKHITD